MPQRSLADDIYGYLAEDEDARVCREIPPEACNEQPRSFLLQLVSLTLTRLGDTLISPRLVLAWMLSALAAPAIFIAFLVPLRESFALLPQLLIAQYLRERPVRKGFWVAGAFGQAIALLAMILAVLWLDGAALGWAVVAALAVFSLARGVCSVTAKDVLGKTVSKTRRGRLTGQAASAAGGATLLVAATIMFAPVFLPDVEGSRLLFATLLGGSAALWILAGWLYGAIPEVPGATSGGGNAFAEAWRSVGLLVRDRQFAAFVQARALLVASAFAIPYIVVLVQRAAEENMQRAGESGATTLGAMLLASGLAALLGGAAWGKLADRDARVAMIAGALLSVLVMIAALLLHVFQREWLGTSGVAAALLFTAAVAHDGARVGRKTYLVDMAGSDRRAQYVAVSNTVMGVVLLAGVLLGWLDQVFGAAGVLVLLAALGVLAAIRCRRLPGVSG
ncbi:MAG TPA: MFS transporter permease [Gammaproteobacteria bacterium]